MKIDKNMISKISDGRGFTLLELIVVLALLAILASVSVPKFMDLSANAGRKTLQADVAKLNSRENLVWLKLRNSQIGSADDAAAFSQIDTDLGPNYHWSPKAEIDGGILYFKDRG